MNMINIKPLQAIVTVVNNLIKDEYLIDEPRLIITAMVRDGLADTEDVLELLQLDSESAFNALSSVISVEFIKMSEEELAIGALTEEMIQVGILNPSKGEEFFEDVKNSDDDFIEHVVDCYANGSQVVLSYMFKSITCHEHINYSKVKQELSTKPSEPTSEPEEPSQEVVEAFGEPPEHMKKEKPVKMSRDELPTDIRPVNEIGPIEFKGHNYYVATPESWFKSPWSTKEQPNECFKGVGCPTSGARTMKRLRNVENYKYVIRNIVTNAGEEWFVPSSEELREVLFANVDAYNEATNSTDLLTTKVLSSSLTRGVPTLMDMVTGEEEDCLPTDAHTMILMRKEEVK